jgi:hypothetical protein
MAGGTGAGCRSSIQVEEDLMQNPFLRVLRVHFESLYQHVATRGDDTTVLVPCAECLDGEGFDQLIMEAHILQTTHVPGCYMNMMGQGVEIQGNCVSTDLGFSDHRTCEILQTESHYDHGNTFRVLVIDKPLVGKYKSIPSSGDRSATSAGAKSAGGAASSGAGGSVTSWLNSAPAIEDAFYDQLLQFRRTFVQVPGCEQSTAERIREIVGDNSRKLIRHHGLLQPTQQRQLDYQVSRNAYALLHSFVFPHLQRVLKPAEQRLEKAIRCFDTAEELLNFVPGAAGRGLGKVDVRNCAEHLAAMDREITPHEKIACINEAHSALQRCIADSARGATAAASAAGAPRSPSPSPVEITGDDVLSLFILALRASLVKDRLAHIAYVEMYLQGAAGRTGTNEAARFEETGYAVSALQAALQFFFEDANRGHPGKSARGGAPIGGARGGLGVAAFGDAYSDAADPVNSQLQGIVRQARDVRQGGPRW